MPGIVKKLLYLNRKAPYGTSAAQESLDVVLIGAAFDQDVSVLFLDDGVYQLVRGQDPSGIGHKHFSATFRALGDFDVRRVYVDRESLSARGLVPGDLVQIAWEGSEPDDAVADILEVIDAARASALMEEASVVFSF